MVLLQPTLELLGSRDFLQEKVRGKWYRRMVEENGLESDQEGSAKEEECEFVATFQGGAKARIRHRFERKKIIISTEVMHKATDNPFWPAARLRR